VPALTLLSALAEGVSGSSSSSSSSALPPPGWRAVALALPPLLAAAWRRPAGDRRGTLAVSLAALDVASAMAGAEEEHEQDQKQGASSSPSSSSPLRPLLLPGCLPALVSIVSSLLASERGVEEEELAACRAALLIERLVGGARGSGDNGDNAPLRALAALVLPPWPRPSPLLPPVLSAAAAAVQPGGARALLASKEPRPRAQLAAVRLLARCAAVEEGAVAGSGGPGLGLAPPPPPPPPSLLPPPRVPGSGAGNGGGAAACLLQDGLARLRAEAAKRGDKALARACLLLAPRCSSSSSSLAARP
jgi:hypothetical protein